MKNDLEAATEFLAVLRPGGPWNLSCGHADGRPGMVSVTTSDPAEARVWIAAHEGRNVFFVPNPAPQPTGHGGRARKSDITSIDVVHVDLDLDKVPDDHAWAALPLNERKVLAVEQLQAFDRPCPPTMIVDSGGGLHVYWRLDYQMPTSDPANVAHAEAINAWLAQQFPGGDPACKDIGHLMRLPGTINWPSAAKRHRGRTPVMARVVATGGPTAADYEFPAPTAPAVPASGSGGGELEPAQLATWLAVIDATHYGTGRHDAWISISAACHSATAGDGFDEWADWCRTDPDYADLDDEVLRARWDSFDVDRRGTRATIGTLARAVIDAGHGELVRRLDAVEPYDDFDDAPLTDLDIYGPGEHD